MTNPRTGEILDGIPVFSSDAVLWDSAKLPQIQYTASEGAIRVTLSDSHQPFDTTSQLTEVADELFSRFATACGAVVVEHEWGFAKIPEQDTPDTANSLARHPIYPEGFTLVARVEVIRRIFNTLPLAIHQSIITGHEQALQKGYVGGMEAPKRTGESFRLTDYPRERQYKLPKDFGYGRAGLGLANHNRLYFLDIEPYVMSNDPNFVVPYAPSQKDDSENNFNRWSI